MKNLLPVSLVQIHYHDRAGGVREVMRSYSETFKKMSGKDVVDIWICSRSGTGQYTGGCHYIHVPQADYHYFRSVERFTAAVENLTRILSTILQSTAVKLPVAVVGHNLNLGKNMALSAAFRNCACRFGNNSGNYRFFSVMHDFMEDGRSTIAGPLQTLGTAGIDIDAIRYTSGAPVRFIVPNRNTTVLSGLGKKNLTILPNRLSTSEVPEATMDTAFLRERLRRLAKSDGLAFDPARRLYCYPSRIIYRKNIFEAYLIATVIFQGSLVTGAAGTSVNDRRRLDVVCRMARENCRSFVYDPSRISENRQTDSSVSGNIFTVLYSAVDAVISTSRTEGFGYSLFEPWNYGRKVIGRMPSGTTLLPDMQIPSLYWRLPIPVEWVSIDKCHHGFAVSYQKTFGKTYPSFQVFTKKFIHEDTIDFGIIDESQQIAIVNRLQKREGDLYRLVSGLQKKHRGWPGLNALEDIDESLIQHNARCVRSWSGYGFANTFEKCLSTCPVLPARSVWYTKIASYFQQLNNFRPNTTY